MKIVLTVFGLVLAGLLSMPVARAEGMPGTPTVLVPTSTAHTSQVKPVLAGVTQSGTQVDVYIDNQFYGHATVVEGHHGTAHWSYVPFLNLSHGWHTIQVKAQNAAGARSLVSQPTYVFVDLLVPSPTLLTPVVNVDTVASKPWIVGLTKGGMTLDVWIDGELNGSVEVAGDVQDTASFKYQPFLPLNVGTHQVSVVAKDPYGGQSQAATMSFKVEAPVQRTADVTSVSAEATTSTEEPTSAESQTDSTTPQAEEPEVQPELAPAEEASTPAVEPEAETAAEPESTEEANQPTEEASEQPASESTEEGAEQPASEEAGPEEEPTEQDTESRSNVLSTVGWVLLALVAIGMITRGRGKPKSADELVKLDTTGSTPHVEVIRKAEQTPGATSPASAASTPIAANPSTPSTSSPASSTTQVPPSTPPTTPNTPSA